jgi:hypothetical protein
VSDVDKLRDIVKTFERSDERPSRDNVVKQFHYETGRDPEGADRYLDRLEQVYDAVRS